MRVSVGVVSLAPLCLVAAVGCSNSRPDSSAAAAAAAGSATARRHTATPSRRPVAAKLAPAGTQGDWTTRNLSFNASTMLLLTDGRLLVQSEDTPQWFALSPDASGSYVAGTLTPVASMTKGRLYYASAVLADGRAVVMGGEYIDNGQQTEDGTAEIYDPLADKWTTIPSPPGWSNIGDASSAVLADGRVLLGSIFDSRTALWDPKTNSWSNAGTKLGASDEESWVLLPDGSIITADCSSARQGRSELWIPGTGWIDAGQLPVSIVQASSEEIGPGMLLPDGRAMFIGATGHTALYTPAATLGQVGTWSVGPDMPNDASGQQAIAKDAPGILLPNGHFIVAASAPGASGWGGPTTFFDVDTTVSPMTITTGSSPPNNDGPPYEGRMMLLPSGEVVYAQGTAQLSFWAPAVTPIVTAPAIATAPAEAQAGSSFTLTGTNLNGVSQTVGYGDDASMATNYPLVRLKNVATGAVTYARTHDHSTMAVATGAAVVSTQVTLPTSLAPGAYQLVVVANAVASAPVALQVTAGVCTGCVDGSGACQTGATATACGTGGNACVACPTNQACIGGVCATPVCNGCVDGSGGCQAGTTATACGTSGNACVACGANQLCSNGACVTAPCTGCLDGSGTCQSGTTATACGTGGNACMACGTNQVCSNGACVTPVCNGCVDGSGTCQSGTTATACGIGGNACVACANGQTCSGGSCVAVGVCDHAICTQGTKLTSGCDPCATKICAADAYCCNNSWDGICVNEVSSVCGQTCVAACTHAICASGQALVSGCDACATKICAADAYCCATFWDRTCVSEVASICSQSCN
jgi:hypothetical protein